MYQFSSSRSSVSFLCLSKTHLSNKENPFPEMGCVPLSRVGGAKTDSTLRRVGALNEQQNTAERLWCYVLAGTNIAAVNPAVRVGSCLLEPRPQRMAETLTRPLWDSQVPWRKLLLLLSSSEAEWAAAASNWETCTELRSPAERILRQHLGYMLHSVMKFNQYVLQDTPVNHNENKVWKWWERQSCVIWRGSR